MKSERDAIQQRITNAMTQLARREAVPLVRHFLLTRQGAELRIACWCGQARLIETQYPGVFVRSMNEFFYIHEDCDPKDSR